jgi:phosphate acetyltransferase
MGAAADGTHGDGGGAMVARLRERARARRGAIGFPDAQDTRVLRVAAQLVAEGSAARVRLYGERAALVALARTVGVDLAGLGAALEVRETDGAQRLAAAAEDLQRGELDAVLAGNLATTADVVRAAISGVGLAPGVKTVSGSFLMCRGEAAGRAAQTLLFADCGVVIAPSLRQLVDIGVESVRTWRALVPEAPPVVAYLSYSTKGSAHHETQERMAEAARLFATAMPDVASDGELQFDAAFDAAIGQRKAPGSAAAGRANCFVFPNLDAGNIAYKIAQRLGGFAALGPILQGLGKPYSDLSRGSTEEDILASAYANLLRAAP